MIKQKKLKKMINYNPKTGICIWLERTPDMFEDGKYSKEHKCNQWNAVYAGKVVGCIDNQNGRILTTINNKRYKLHNIIYIYMTGKKPNKDIDHKNGNPSDNRWINLRLATDSQNQGNRKISKNNKSGYKGVFWVKDHKKWTARGCLNGKIYFLGYYDTPENAYKAYCKWAKKAFGKFFRGA